MITQATTRELDCYAIIYTTFIHNLKLNTKKNAIVIVVVVVSDGKQDASQGNGYGLNTI